MRRALPALLILLSSNAIASHGGIHLADPEGDAVVGGWRGAPLLAGTPCPRTDLLEGNLTAATGGARVILRVQNVTRACFDEHPPHQVFAFTLNLRLPDGSDAWTQAAFAVEDGRIRSLGADSVRCAGHVFTGRCSPAGSSSFSIDAVASNLTFATPFTLSEMAEVSVTSAMWDCGPVAGGTACMTGSFAGPGDQMPDVGGAHAVPLA